MANILVTGSSKGLGKEIAKEFLKRGNDVIVHGRDEDALQKISGTYVVGDITKENTLNELVARANDLDILVNNVGVYAKKSVGELTMGEIRYLMEVNFFSNVALTMSILPIFERKRSGLIVNINSIAGKQECAGESIYSASKHALDGFCKSLKYETVSKGIRVMNVYPGGIKTPMSAHRGEYERLMDPREIAEIIVDNCERRDSVYIPELHLGRVKY